MKSILMSIQPYWGFLIIAKKRGWDLEKYGLHEKTVEVRKGIPTSPDWDKKVALYFSKDKKSLARIPEEYRGEVAKLCGKIVCEFVCEKAEYLGNITNWDWAYLAGNIHEYHKGLIRNRACLIEKEVHDYFGHKSGYALHISDLKIYEKPKELSEFEATIVIPKGTQWFGNKYANKHTFNKKLTRPPQSWCYVEKL